MLGYGLAVSDVEFADTDDTLLRLSLIGAVCSPFLLHQRRTHPGWGARTAGAAIGRSMIRLCVAALLVTAIAIVIRSFNQVPRAWAASWFVSSALGVSGGRLLLFRLMRALTARGLLADHVAVLGWGPAADWLRAILAQPHPFAPSPPLGGSGPARDRLEQELADILERGKRGRLDRVVLALPGADGPEVDAIAHRLGALGAEVASIYPTFPRNDGRVRNSELAGVPLYVITPRPHDGWGRLAKAVEDWALASVLIVLLSPVLLLVALAVRLDSAGPVIFRQRRHGLNGTEFDVFKFRTMHWHGAGAGSGETQTLRRDKRVTRIGRILRRTSLDELPQLLNVLNGTMSVVGPRPHPVSMRTEQRLGDEIIAEYAHRHRVKPGMTGWAQVNGFRGATDTAEKLRRRVEHDIYYIENWSLSFDLLILFSTIFSVLFSRENAF